MARNRHTLHKSVLLGAYQSGLVQGPCLHVVAVCRVRVAVVLCDWRAAPAAVGRGDAVNGLLGSVVVRQQPVGNSRCCSRGRISAAEGALFAEGVCSAEVQQECSVGGVEALCMDLAGDVLLLFHALSCHGHVAGVLCALFALCGGLPADRPADT